MGFEKVGFWIFGETCGVLDLEGGGGGVTDGELIILALVSYFDFRGEMVLVCFWSWGTIDSAREEGSRKSLALVVLTFFGPKASSSPCPLCFSGISSSSLSSSSLASTSSTTLVFLSCLVFRQFSMNNNYAARQPFLMHLACCNLLVPGK